MMPFSDTVNRLQGLGADKWAVHFRARALAAAGREIIELTIGEPDRTPDPAILDALTKSLMAGRTRYSDGRGEPAVLDALAAKYSARTGREVTRSNILTVPGTQAALFSTIAALAGSGTEVALPDPYYATYEGVIAASGASLRAVPMTAEDGFRLTPAALEAAITPATRVLLLNNPHNPTGTVLTAPEVAAIAEVCARHDLWIVSDEVYEALIFDGPDRFASPFDMAEYADRTIALSSISKSEAVPGFRSGWIAGPASVCARIQPLIEMMFFGNQPFIADATAYALTHPSPTAGALRADYARRAALAASILAQAPSLKPMMPQSGMFLMLDVRGTGRDGLGFAEGLLDAQSVAVMPGNAFGTQAAGFVRLSLTVPDARLTEACQRIASHAASLQALARDRTAAAAS